MELLPLLILPLLLSIAAVSDAMTMTIPNWISAMLVVTFLALSLAVGMPMQDIAWSVGVGFLVLLMGMALFALNWLGGGDAKLLAATALWFGWAGVFQFLIYTMFAGGALSLLLISFRAVALPEQVTEVRWVARLHKAGEALPYGIAIAIGGLAALSQVPVLSHLAG